VPDSLPHHIPVEIMLTILIYL